MILSNRYDILTFISVKNSLLQGDPDNSNEPRVDPTTYHGLFTPMGYHRHIRDYAHEVHGQRLWIARKEDLSKIPLEVAAKLKLPKAGKDKKSVNLDTEQADKLVKTLGAELFDFRAFGGLLTSFNHGVRGPVQTTMGESLDPVNIRRMSITRCAIANEEEAKTKDKTMGNYATINYGLYQIKTSINPYYAAKTGFSDDDMPLLLEAMLRCFEHTASTLRSDVSVPYMYVFKHDSVLGNVPRHKLFESVRMESAFRDPRKFEDYTEQTNFDSLKGVTVFKVETVEDILKAFPSKKAA